MASGRRSTLADDPVDDLDHAGAARVGCDDGCGLLAGVEGIVDRDGAAGGGESVVVLGVVMAATLTPSQSIFPRRFATPKLAENQHSQGNRKLCHEYKVRRLSGVLDESGYFADCLPERSGGKVGPGCGDQVRTAGTRPDAGTKTRRGWEHWYGVGAAARHSGHARARPDSCRKGRSTGRPPNPGCRTSRFRLPGTRPRVCQCRIVRATELGLPPPRRRDFHGRRHTGPGGPASSDQGRSCRQVRFLRTFLLSAHPLGG